MARPVPAGMVTSVGTKFVGCGGSGVVVAAPFEVSSDCVVPVSAVALSGAAPGLEGAPAEVPGVPAVIRAKGLGPENTTVLPGAGRAPLL